MEFWGCPPELPTSGSRSPSIETVSLGWLGDRNQHWNWRFIPLVYFPLTGYTMTGNQRKRKRYPSKIKDNNRGFKDKWEVTMKQLVCSCYIGTFTLQLFFVGNEAHSEQGAWKWGETHWFQHGGRKCTNSWRQRRPSELSWKWTWVLHSRSCGYTDWCQSSTWKTKDIFLQCLPGRLVNFATLVKLIVDPQTSVC